MRFTHPLLLIIVGWTAALAGCAHSETAPPTAQMKVPEFDGKPLRLAVNGFNYTDLTISFFAVNGAGGGNIFVSSPTSGGGGTSCCITLHPGTPLPRPITVEWMRLVNGKDRWCKKVVELAGPIPERPTSLGVHFMPNGEIEVEVTAGYPKLKLQLSSFNDGHRKDSGNVVYDEQVAECRNG